MISILINNNRCELIGPLKQKQKLYKEFKVRNPHAFHLRRYMPRGWDGKFDYIDADNHGFQSGLLQKVCDKAKELHIKIKLEDNRDIDFLDKAKLRKKLREPYVLRPDQLEPIQSLLDSKIGKVVWPRGGLKIATNGGKTFISSGIYEAYRQPTIFVMNSKELFVQALKDIPKIIKTGKVGYIGNGKVVMGDFMICMVMSLKNRLKDKRVKEWLNSCKVALFDEGDMADNKTNKTVIKQLYNVVVRVALSGTLNASPRKADLMHNMNIEGFFGSLLHETTNRKLIDIGISSEVRVKFIRGNTEIFEGKNYPSEVEQGIIKNKERNKKIIERIKYHLSKGRDHQLIIIQRHEHIKRVFKRLEKEDLGVNIDWVHHSRKDRFKVVDRFESGKINILIGSMILKRGKNFPLMNYMLNAGGGKSPENITQLLGRAFRGCKIYEDFWDLGFYLKKHSRRRFNEYRKEKIEVVNKFNVTLRKKKI